MQHLSRDEMDGIAPSPPEPRRRRRWRGPWTRRWRARWLAGLLAAGGLGLGVAVFGASDAATPVAQAPPPAGWVDVIRPIALYGVAMPELDGLDAAYEARRHEPGGGRRDVLAWGRLGETPYLRLALYRIGAEESGEPSLFVEAARRSSEIGYSVAALGKPDQLTTRFGGFEVADIRLERGADARACLAFLLREKAGVMRMSGLSCGRDDAPIDRAALGCQLDRIDLISAGEDEALRNVFVAAERKRDMRCASHHARASWLEPRGHTPRLRGAPDVTTTASVKPQRKKR